MRDGTFPMLPLHRSRFEATGLRFFGRAAPFPDLSGIARENPGGTFKVRIVYGRDVESVEAAPYAPRRVASLKVVESAPFDYSSKFLDRARLEELFEMRGACDDVIISVGGNVTDTSFSNLAFLKGGRLYTPDTFLLDGVRRRAMMACGSLHPARIRASDIKDFERVFIINAMRGPEDSPGTETERVE